MDGKGPRYERETIIRYDEETDTAEVWTASEVTYRQMLKRGFTPTQDNERSAAFIIPKKFVKLPRKPTKAMIDRGKALAARQHGTEIESKAVSST